MDIRKLAPGDRVLDYRILERLGEGGFGEVFRAQHEHLARVVALKVPRDASGVAALRHEGVVQSSLEHPNIVRTLELSLSHDPPYVVMEYVEGRSLAELLRREGPLPWKRAARVLRDAARALAHAHGKGVVHGDVKPGNLLVDGETVKLTDFGLGRVFEGPQGNLQISRSLELATSGAEVQGTIRYLAPEVLRGEPADERADVYSFGVLLFEALTGRLPEGREIPSELVSGVPPELDALFTRTFARKERRPRSLDGVLAVLDQLLEPATPARGSAPGSVAALPAGFTPLHGSNQREAFTAPGSVTGASAPDATIASARARHATEGATEGAIGAAGAGSGSAVAPALSEAAAKLLEARSVPGFHHFGEQLMRRVRERMLAGGTALTGAGTFDACFEVTAEGEPHHRIYALVLPRLDAAIARAVAAEGRRLFDQEKGIWEKEVTFWVIAREVEQREQVLTTFRAFAMGWWRRRRVVVQDLRDERVHAAELGCDPRGNPLKRRFLAAVEQSLPEVAAAERTPVALDADYPRGSLRGTAWGAALALVMVFGLLGSIMAMEMVGRELRCKRMCPKPPASMRGVGRAMPSWVPAGDDAAALIGAQLERERPPEPLPPRAPAEFQPEEPAAPTYY